MVLPLPLRFSSPLKKSPICDTLFHKIVYILRYRINYWIEFTQGDPDSNFNGLNAQEFEYPITVEESFEILSAVRCCGIDEITIEDPGLKYFLWSRGFIYPGK